jgi:hypothetical protein
MAKPRDEQGAPAYFLIGVAARQLTDRSDMVLSHVSPEDRAQVISELLYEMGEQMGYYHASLIEKAKKKKSHQSPRSSTRQQRCKPRT